MIPTRFTKPYVNAEAADAAARHHRWLAVHAPSLRQPDLIVAAANSLAFEWIDGRHARPTDLVRLAGILGDAHGAAWSTDLHRATLDEPYAFRDGTPFPDFLSVRKAVLRRRLEQGHLPDEAALQMALSVLEHVAEGPAAFYKDSNPRNFLIADDGTVFTVDTDDLGLAPFGYDLAKLIAALVMTYGPIGTRSIDEALAAYNRACAAYGPLLGTTNRKRLDDFLALHCVFTAPYAGRNGYHYGPLPLTAHRKGLL
ncbi:aminoglycoside phosphotransferase family protein [Streptomyces sp. NBC_00160]|uniref:phosphotransferase n=1 Tax=Streptomyces sp. NBC_00160 TaxID=2903628 RepID=UPI00225ADF33|nr:phosphotransferase [Streptomyces sp. NBC_00160]MCX5302811.1 aminoglycoside phosphotransferase family protein [Streptomyces sp. NBC_00160]